MTLQTMSLQSAAAIASPLRASLCYQVHGNCRNPKIQMFSLSCSRPKMSTTDLSTYQHFGEYHGAIPQSGTVFFFGFLYLYLYFWISEYWNHFNKLIKAWINILLKYRFFETYKILNYTIWKLQNLKPPKFENCIFIWVFRWSAFSTRRRNRSRPARLWSKPKKRFNWPSGNSELW